MCPGSVLSAILFLSLLLTSNTASDHDEIITEEDIRAFEEAVAEDRRPANGFSILAPETKVIDTKRVSGRSRKVNLRAQQQQSQRKRGRQRPFLRRSGMALTANHSRVVLRKRKKKPAAPPFPTKKISGDTPLTTTNRRKGQQRILTRERLLGKSDGPPIDEEKNIEKAVLQALEEASTTVLPVTKEFSMLKMTPPRRGDSFVRISTTTASTTTTKTAGLDDLIAALESIEPADVAVDVVETTTSSSATTTTARSTTETATRRLETTPAPITTMDIILLLGSTAEGTSTPETTTLPPRTRPTALPSTDLEAQLLSDQIESNFIHEEPQPPAHPQPQVGPPAGPPVKAPPGEQPPSDLVVSELNTADDFLAVARRLQIFRRKQTTL